MLRKASLFDRALHGELRRAAYVSTRELFAGPFPPNNGTIAGQRVLVDLRLAARLQYALRVKAALWRNQSSLSWAANMKLAFGVERSNRKYRLRLARYQYLAEVLEARLAGRAWVLDAGCGKGRLPIYWKPEGEGRRRIVGADISPQRLQGASKRGYDGLVRVDLCAEWPFASGAFDAVIIEQVLEHLNLDQIHRVLGHAARVLKPGGLLLIGTPVFKRVELLFAPLWLRLSAVRHRLKGGTPAHIQHFMLRHVTGLLAEHGFETERVQGHRLFSLPGALLEDHGWYYRLQRWFGKKAPGLCVECTVLAQRIS